MRSSLFIFMLILLTACSAEKPVEIERDIYITSFDTDFGVDGKFNLKDSAQAIHLSKEFWGYFIRTHPKTSSLIFIMPLADTNNNYVALPDSSYCFYNVAEMNSFYLSKLLADSVTGQEKATQSGASFFVIPDDTTGASAKEEKIKNNLKDYQINPTVIKDFDRLKSVLTWQDTSKHYVIVFKKSFADKIYKLYE